MRFISRIDARSTHCYTLRIYHNGKYIEHHTFSDSVYGGKGKALTATKKARAELIKKYKITKRIITPIHTHNSRNLSGVIGVHLSVTYSQIGNPSYAWVATYQIYKGKHVSYKRRSFALNKYGYETAFYFAVNERCNHTKQPNPNGIKPPPKPKYVY